MCGVIALDAGRSRSTCHRRDAYIHDHCLRYRHNFALFYITVVPNDKNELIPQRIVTGYRMVIDFRKLNKATRKDHYPLPFIDQMLERLSKHTHFFFPDGYSGFS